MRHPWLTTLLTLASVASAASAVAPVAAAKNDAQPLRVLLVASGPTRDYHFVRKLLVRAVEEQKAELSVCLQSIELREDVSQDVPADRLLRRFPDAIGDPADDKPEERHYNLRRYDVVVMFDPDWNKVEIDLLRRWVTQYGGGLVLGAGPIQTLHAARSFGRASRRRNCIRSSWPIRGWLDLTGAPSILAVSTSGIRLQNSVS